MQGSTQDIKVYLILSTKFTFIGLKFDFIREEELIWKIASGQKTFKISKYILVVTQHIFTSMKIPNPNEEPPLTSTTPIQTIMTWQFFAT